MELCTVCRSLAKPVDVLERDAPLHQYAARSHDDSPFTGLDSYHIEWLASRHLQPAPLAHREIDNAIVPAKDAPIYMHDFASFRGLGPEAQDHILITSTGHEADILAVRLLSHRQTESLCD